jgi:hypothetical protein
MSKSSKRKASESSIAADNVSNAINTASSIKRSRITANQPISPTSELPPVEVGTAANSAQIDEGLVIADGITNERVSASTKALYTSNFRIISKRCAEIDPSSIDSDGLLKFPCNEVVLKSFFGKMVTEREDKYVRSFSTVAGNMSAIKYFAGEKNIRLSIEMESWFNKFLEGLKRTITKKKDLGIMKKSAGWSLGQVQDRYITYSDCGDHLCGRVAAELSFASGSHSPTSFAVLPPHFKDGNVLSNGSGL